ncbi:MAG: hypothetical protein QXX95_05720 [Nitrososphaerales archaeon]
MNLASGSGGEATWQYNFQPFSLVGANWQGMWSSFVTVVDNSGNSINSAIKNFQYGVSSVEETTAQTQIQQPLTQPSITQDPTTKVR